MGQLGNWLGPSWVRPFPVRYDPIVVMSTPQFVLCAVVAAGRLPFIWQKQQLNVFVMAIVLIIIIMAAIVVFLPNNLLLASFGSAVAVAVVVAVRYNAAASDFSTATAMKINAKQISS